MLKNITHTLLAALVLSACGPRVETKETLVPIAQGTESHGGDVLRARAQEFKDLLTKTQQQLDQESIGVEKRYRLAIRPRLVQVWRGLEVLAKRLSQNQLSQDLSLLLQPSIFPGKSAIQNDIEVSPFDVKSFAPASDPNSMDSAYGRCLDYRGVSATASAQMGSFGGVICIDTKKLAVEAPEEFEVLSLLSHEFAHHFGIPEERAIEVQKFVRTNAGLALKVADLLDSHNSTTIPAESDLDVAVYVIEAIPLGTEKLSCIRPDFCNFRIIDMNNPEDSQAMVPDLGSGISAKLVFDARRVKPGIAISIPLMELAKAGTWRIEVSTYSPTGQFLTRSTYEGGTTRYTVFFK